MVPWATDQRPGLQVFSHVCKELPINHSLRSSNYISDIFELGAVLNNPTLTAAVLCLENHNDRSSLFFKG